MLHKKVRDMIFYNEVGQVDIEWGLGSLPVIIYKESECL